jgi:hypothetical protein
MADWISVNPVSGTGSGTSTVTVAAHTGRSQRQRNIRVTAGSLSHVVEVTQLGASAALSITSNTFSGNNIAASAGTYLISGRSNTPDLKVIVTSGTAAIISGIKLTKLNGVTKNVAMTSSGGSTPTYTVTVPNDPGASAQYTFTLTVTTTANTATTTRQVKYRLGGTGASNTSIYTATQVAASAELTVTPSAMVFLADGTIDPDSTNIVSITTTSQSTTWTIDITETQNS